MIRILRVAMLGAASILAAAPQSKATAILVGQCVEFTTCWSNSSLPLVTWSHNLTGADLASLRLGSTQPFVAAQTSQVQIRLGITTITFDTNSGPISEMLSAFIGGFNPVDPCNFCEVDTVGSFMIPSNATDATISGTFGDNLHPSSAGVNLCVGAGPPCAAVSGIAEPASLTLLSAAFIGLSFVRLRRKLGERTDP
jgi:hypothetical protein